MIEMECVPGEVDLRCGGKATIRLAVRFSSPSEKRPFRVDFLAYDSALVSISPDHLESQAPHGSPGDNVFLDFVVGCIGSISEEEFVGCHLHSPELDARCVLSIRCRPALPSWRPP
ncbi:MAG TPA: hypothetical protein VFC51_10760 [Chloroflexota bacterium]|nr:hypothetical protein [Chloroflexota bacterium]